MNDHKVDTVIEGGGFWSLLLVLAAFAFLVCCWLGGLAYGTEAPGCGNQHYRPRLAQCCPRFCAGEPMPNKCNAALNAGFLGECCALVVADCPVDDVPTPAPSPTCPPEWAYCPQTSPTCAAPTPLPTPDDPEKGACCKEALRIYRDVRRDIVRRYRDELRAVVARKQAQMAVCREGYVR